MWTVLYVFWGIDIYWVQRIDRTIRMNRYRILPRHSYRQSNQLHIQLDKHQLLEHIMHRFRNDRMVACTIQILSNNDILSIILTSKLPSPQVLSLAQSALTKAIRPNIIIFIFLSTELLRCLWLFLFFQKLDFCSRDFFKLKLLVFSKILNCTLELRK